MAVFISVCVLLVQLKKSSIFELGCVKKWLCQRQLNWQIKSLSGVTSVSNVHYMKLVIGNEVFPDSSLIVKVNRPFLFLSLMLIPKLIPNSYIIYKTDKAKLECVLWTQVLFPFPVTVRVMWSLYCKPWNSCVWQTHNWFI